MKGELIMVQFVILHNSVVFIYIKRKGSAVSPSQALSYALCASLLAENLSLGCKAFPSIQRSEITR